MRLNRQSIQELYRLDSIVRYNTIHKNKQETVASHSYFVALFTKMLCTELEVDDIIKLKAIELALVHDIPEIITNDITHDAKQRMPEIVEILAKYENQFMNLHFPELSVQADEVSHIANLIVRLADTISVLQFTNNEINLGNTELLEWIPNTKHRISELRKQLQEVGIKCQKIMI